MLFSVAFSFSITRYVSVVVARLLTNFPILNLIGLLCLLLIQYALLCYWTPATRKALYVIFTTYQGIIQHDPSMSIYDITRNLLFNPLIGLYYDYLAMIHGNRIPPILEVHQIVSLFKVTVLDIYPLSFIFHLSALLNLIPILTRLLIALIFIVSFFLQGFKEKIMELLEAIIISDKPVFRLMFGGIAALGKAIQEIIKLLSS